MDPTHFIIFHLLMWLHGFESITSNLLQLCFLHILGSDFVGMGSQSAEGHDLGSSGALLAPACWLWLAGCGRLALAG